LNLEIGRWRIYTPPVTIIYAPHLDMRLIWRVFLKYRRIEIAVIPEREDPYAKHTMWEIYSTLGYNITGLRIVSVYTIYSDLSDKLISEFAENVLNDPVLTFYSVKNPIAFKLTPFSWAVEVSYKTGVTDNVGHTACDVLNMMIHKYGIEKGSNYRVYKSTQYLFKDDPGLDDIEKIGSTILYNSLIEDIDVLSFSDFKKHGGFFVKERIYNKDYTPAVTVIDLNVPDKRLIEISNERVLALNLVEMKYFRSYFERDDVKKERKKIGISVNPTDVEIECFAQTQSEHCKHKIFNASITYTEYGKKEIIKSIFNTYIKSATEIIGKEKDYLVSLFKDNAGIIKINDDYNLAFKVETHNSPSALDPYGGSITGIVGCDRDPAGTGLGSRIIAHTDVLCFGDPNYKGDLPPRMMHPRRIMEGVIKGIEDGGNKCGIPTINGGIIFDSSYSGKPLVFCGSLGIMPSKIKGKLTHIKETMPGDIIVMVGGRIGKDGIHGATFSSEEIKETSPTQAVQIGDPITQKKMLDMILEARSRLLYRGITDNGAGGLSSSVGEMALLSCGAVIELDKAPLKYTGLDPWEILLSEAQERMTLAVPEENLDEFLKLAKSRDVIATPIGKFTDSGYFHVKYKEKTVCYLDLNFLHSDIPFSLNAKWKEKAVIEKRPEINYDFNSIILELVSDINFSSREPVIRRYDHEVGGNTVIKPLVGNDEIGPSDGGVISPIPGENVGFVLASGINPFLSRIDTYHMAANCIDEAVRNACVVGADPQRIALLDNFCWPDPVYDKIKTPDGEYKLAQLVRAAKGLYETATAYKTPFISGKDSMKNDYKIGDHKVSVLPTILISAVGIIPDVKRCVTSDFKFDDDFIYLLGQTKRHLGQSLFYRKYGGSSKNIPEVNKKANLKMYNTYFNAVNKGLIASGHDLSDGGLALAVAESCIGGFVGARIDLSFCKEKVNLTNDEMLFSETPGRFLISVNPTVERDFISAMKGVYIQKIGRVKNNGRFKIIGKNKNLIADIDIKELTGAYRKPLFSIMGMEE